MKSKIFDLKKIAAAATAIFLSISLAACGSSDKNNSGSSSSMADTSAETSTEQEEEVPAITLPHADSDEPQQPDDSKDENGINTDTSDVPLSPSAWKVTSPDGNTMYMMGSMHALKDECYPLPDYIEQMYTNADVLAVEVDITDFTSIVSGMLQYTDKMTYPNGETVVEHLGEETWNEIASYLEIYGQDPKMYEMYQSWYIYDLLENLALEDVDLSADKGIDVHLLNRAHEDGKEIYEVETMELQMDMLSSLTDDQVKAMVKGYSVENRYEIAQALLDLYKAWKSGDVDAVAENNDTDTSEFTEEELELINEFNHKLIGERNIGMTEKAMELIDSGDNVFYVVGLAHFTGEGGILDLLEQKGCTIERVAA